MAIRIALTQANIVYATWVCMFGLSQSGPLCLPVHIKYELGSTYDTEIQEIFVKNSPQC